MSLAWSASIAAAIPVWVLALKAPTTCGVTTQKGGRCSRPVNGLIFGCGRSEHDGHRLFSVLSDATPDEQREVRLLDWPLVSPLVTVLVAKIPMSEVVSIAGGWSWSGELTD